MEDNKRISGLLFAGIAVASFIVSPDILDITLTPRFIVLALFISFVCLTLYKAANRIRIKADLLLLTYGLYALFCGASVLWANTISEALFESSKVFLGFFVFLLTVFSLKHSPELFMGRLYKWSVIIFFMELSILIFQSTGLNDLGKSSLYDLTGMNGHKNLLSSFLLLNLFFLIQALRYLKAYWRIASGIAIFLTAAILLLLQTKAVWLGLAAGILITVFSYLLIRFRNRVNRKPNVYLIITVLMLLGNLFFLKGLPELINKGLAYNKEVQIPGVNTSNRELDDERLLLWQKTYAIFREKPLYGLGTGNWQVWYPKPGLAQLWRAEELNYTFQRPHNDWLWALSETGLIGFNLLLLFVISIVVYLLKSAVRVAGNKNLTFSLILNTAIITAYVSAAFFDFPRERIEHTIWINLIFGIAYYYISSQMQLQSIFTFRSPKILYPAAAALFLVMAYIGVLRHQGEFSLRKMYAYKVRGKRNEVIDLCKTAESFAYTIDPTSIPICWYSGNARAANGDYSGARADFLKAHRLNPYNRNVLNDLASTYSIEKEHELAKYYYMESARISPRFDDPKLNLAAIYIQEENYIMAWYWLNTLTHPSERRSSYEAIVKNGFARQTYPL